MGMPKNPYPESKGRAYVFGERHRIHKRAQEDMLGWFVEWLGNSYGYHERGQFIVAIPDKEWQELKDKLAELEGKK